MSICEKMAGSIVIRGGNLRELVFLVKFEALISKIDVIRINNRAFSLVFMSLTSFGCKL